MDELKPCPFCGGKAEIAENAECIGHGEYIQQVYVECENCYAQGPVFSDWDYWQLQREEIISLAIKGWNRRAKLLRFVGRLLERFGVERGTEDG